MTPGQAKVERFRFPEQEAYWQAALLGDLPPFNLGDHPRSPVQSFLKKRESSNLDPILDRRLKEFSAGEGLESGVVLLAVFDALMLRYTGQEDIVTGTLFSDAVRERQGSPEYFTNPVALRTRLSGDTSVRECLRRVASTVENAAANRDYPFDKVIELASKNRDLSRSPLCQVMCIFQDMPLCDTARPILETNVEDAEEYTTRCDLVLLFSTSEGLLRIDCEFDAELFERATVARLLNHFQNLLKGFLVGPERQLSTLSLLTEAERSRLLVEWNATHTDYPRDLCLHELFEAQVKRTPDAVAVVFKDNQLTYRDLNVRANQLAHYLRRFGVGPDLLVGIAMERSLEMVIGILGILKAGGAYVPLDPAYPQERIAYILEDAQVQVVVTEQRMSEGLTRHAARVVCVDKEWKTLGRGSKDNPTAEITATNLAYVIYTSGSTGQPKGVAIEHRSAVALLSWAKTIYTAEDLTGVLASTSICFDLSVFELFCPLACGGRVIMVKDALDLSALPPNAGVTLVNTVPSAIAELLRADNGLPASVRTVNLAGEPLSNALVHQLYQREGIQQVFDLYGPSEDTTYSTYALRKSAGPATIGRPIANTQIYILDPYLQPVPLGVPGELHIGGEGLARGYLNRPELTSERFIPDPFSNQLGARFYRTGDLARYLPDGNIQFLGRLDYQVKIRGFRIECGEIETALNTHPAVREVVVVAHEDCTSDKRLVAYVVTGQEKAPTIADLRGFLKQRLPDYMVPSTFVTLDFLPMTPNGKVDRRALRVADLSKLESDRVYVPPQNELEKSIVRIWQEVLQVERVGTQDNFFDLGGHSLMMMQVNRQISDVIGRNIPIVQMFRYPTVSMLARSLSQDSNVQPSLRQSASRGQARRESMMRRQQPR